MNESKEAARAHVVPNENLDLGVVVPKSKVSKK